MVAIQGKSLGSSNGGVCVAAEKTLGCLGRIPGVGLAWRSHHPWRVGCLLMANSHLSFRRKTSWLLLELLDSQKGDAGIDRHILQAVTAQPTSSLKEESRP